MEESCESCFFKIKISIKAMFQDKETYERSFKGLRILSKQTSDVILKLITLKYESF